MTSRLQAVADLVPECGRLLDIGTDHALLPINLVGKNRCSSALAVDLRPGPLAAARRNIARAGLEKRIMTVQSCGLQAVTLGESDVLVMAGMGGYEMMAILGDQPRICREIVLQPMKSVPELRSWLCKKGYVIEKESLAIEKRHVYVVLSCRYTGEVTVLPELERLIGPCLMKTRPEGYAQYLSHLAVRLNKQLLGQPVLAASLQDLERMLNSDANRPD